jgi:CRP-like cAMP-binding protein
MRSRSRRTDACYAVNPAEPASCGNFARRLLKFFSNLNPISLPLQKIIYEVGAPLEHVYFVEGGVASIITKMTNGDSIEAGMIGSEGVVGLPALLGRKTSGQHVIVQAPLTALRMDVADCKTAFEQSAAVREVLLRYTATLLDIASQTAACNQLHSLKERCARWILMMHDRLQTEAMPLTHEFFAIMLGTRRVRITEVAVDLQRTGLIRYQRGLVTVLDHSALAIAACECYRDHDRLSN